MELKLSWIPPPTFFFLRWLTTLSTQKHFPWKQKKIKKNSQDTKNKRERQQCYFKIKEKILTLFYNIFQKY